MKMKPISSIIASLALSAPGISSADTINFSFNGVVPAVATNGIDYLPGNALAVNSIPLVVGGVFTTYVQAEASLLVGPGYAGGSMSIPTGANGGYELTVSIELNERLRSAFDLGYGGPAPDLLVFDHLGGTFTLRYDNFAGGTINANGLTNNNGLGYQDGLVIMTGTIDARDAGASYVLANGPLIPLDGFGTDNLPGVDSLQGSGSTSFRVTVTFAHPDFFVSPPAVVDVELDSTLTTPFDSVNPELSVLGHVPVRGVGGDNTTTCVSNGTCDFQFEADGNSSFSAAAVPEPASLALLGIGLLGWGVSRRRVTRRGD